MTGKAVKIWNGNLISGKGKVNFNSSAIGTRGVTSPAELIAAADGLAE